MADRPAPTVTTVRKLGSITAAAEQRGVSVQSIERALQRAGEHGLLARMQGAPATPPVEPPPASVPVRRSRGGQWQAPAAGDDLERWQAARERARRTQPAQFVRMASGELAEGVRVSDEDLEVLVRLERARAVEEARATLERVRRG